jgi:peptidoglycan/LPS O-acetylase OafA/YrhL
MSPTALPYHPKYRSDIDGLRAIAVLLVIWFHAFPTLIPGGFIGVDIFFVISGFLISTIIFGALEQDNFSFFTFYGRRIRRIFPALLLVLAACYALGWFTLLADEYKQLGKHIAAGASFFSNFALWKESGYFDNAAETKPLLHLWSLGIEEQFYIVWPISVWLVWKKKAHALKLICGTALLSFLWNIYSSHTNAVADFYSPQTRFWELLIGTFLAYSMLYPQQKCFAPFLKLYEKASNAAKSRLMSCAAIMGAILLLAGLLLITKERNFPGWWALFPTLGAALILGAGANAWFNRTILANPLLVWVGLISYPLYLWHWPLLSFARILEGADPSVTTRLIAVLISVALAWITYCYVEKPTRFGKHIRAKTLLLVLLMAIIGYYAGYNTARRGGLSFRTVVAMQNYAKLSNDGLDEGHTKDGCGLSPANQSIVANCKHDSRESARYALLGDSKADAFYSGLVRTSHANSRWLFIGGAGKDSALVPVLSDQPLYKQYQAVTHAALLTILNNPEINLVVILVATRALFQLKGESSIDDLPTNPNYDTALEGLSNTTKMLLKAGKQVVFIVDNPTLPDPRDCIVRKTALDVLNKIWVQKPNLNCNVPLATHRLFSKRYRDLLQAIHQINPEKITIFDTTRYFCDLEKGMCGSYSSNGRLLYSYTDHMSDYAAGLIGADLNALLARYESQK